MIIPRPLAPTRAPGRFLIPASLHLTSTPGAERPARLLAEYLGPDRPRTSQGPRIHLELTAAATAAAASSPGGINAEAYHLEITTDSVRLAAPAETGLFHGVQTLRQLLAAAPDGASWPCLTLDDAPLLPWRGVMLDVARHFMPLDFLYAFVDLLALHKLNVLHLHLTDDQGWRIEIEGRPRLTEVGAWRTESMAGPAGSDRFDGVPHGGFYTRKELGDLVRHAADRGVRVVPEIEMPGHARAALAAYPELSVHGRALPVWTSWGVCEDVFGVHDRALDFCREVLGQVAEVFPDRYVHVGGDECPTAQWAADPWSRRRAAELGLDGPAGLHPWFLGRMRDWLAEHGRRAISWDTAEPAPDGLPADLVLAAWLDAADAARAVERGHQVLLAPHRSTFLDYAQRDHPDEPSGQPGGVVTLADVYTFDPLALDAAEAPVQARHAGPGPASASAAAAAPRLPIVDPFAPGAPVPGVLGAQAQLWTEFLPTPAHVLHAAFPRLCAFAETAWSGGARDYPDFRSRLAAHAPLLVRLGALTSRRAADPADVWCVDEPDRPAKIEA